MGFKVRLNLFITDGQSASCNNQTYRFSPSGVDGDPTQVIEKGSDCTLSYIIPTYQAQGTDSRNIERVRGW